MNGGSRWIDFEANCSERDRSALTNASNLAAIKIITCFRGFCGQPAGQRKWLNALYIGKTGCPRLTNLAGQSIANGIISQPNYFIAANTWSRRYTEFYQGVIEDFYRGKPECLAMMFAHEALHRGLVDSQIYLPDFNYLSALQESISFDIRLRESNTIYLGKELEERFIDDAVDRCFDCNTTGTVDNTSRIVHNPSGWHPGRFDQ